MQAGEAAEPAVGEHDVLVEIHAAPPRPAPLFDKQIRKINGMT
jgi:hypothetical protein